MNRTFASMLLPLTGTLMTLMLSAPITADGAAPAKKPAAPAYSEQTQSILNLRKKADEAKAPQPSRPQDPRIAAEGKDTPRGWTRSYSSAEEALRQSDTSKYLQPLDGPWKSSPWQEGKLSGTRFERNYKLPFAWVDRQLFLRLGSVTGSYEIRVNGTPVAYSQDGATPAEYDLTKYSKEGNNTLEIIVFNTPASRALENYLTGEPTPAITGEAYIVAQPRIRIRDIVTDTRVEGKNGLFSLGVVMKSHLLNFKEYNIYFELLSPEGKVVAQAHREARFDLKREDTVRFFANIPDIRPWNHESPNLYTLQLRTQYEGRFQEYLSFPVGFRSAELSEGKLLVNGRQIPLQVAEYRGAADTAAMHRELAALKSKGINTIKVMGHPQPEAFYRMCDRLGLYVCDQANIDTNKGGTSIKKSGNPSNDPRWRDAYTERALSMYYNSRNHPSVILFSLADRAANGYNLYESYLALKEAEKERPVIYTGANGEWNTDAVTDSLPGDKRFAFAPAEISNITIAPPVTIEETDARKGVFRIVNSYDLTPLEGECVSYRILAGRKTIAEGKKVLSAAAGESATIAIPIPPKTKPGTPLEFVISVEREIPVAYRYVLPAANTATEKESVVSKVMGSIRTKEQTQAPVRVTLAEKSFNATY